MKKIHVNVALFIAYIDGKIWSLSDLNFFEDSIGRVPLTDPEKIKSEFERRYKGEAIQVSFEQ